MSGHIYNITTVSCNKIGEFDASEVFTPKALPVPWEVMWLAVTCHYVLSVSPVAAYYVCCHHTVYLPRLSHPPTPAVSPLDTSPLLPRMKLLELLE